VVVQSLLIEGVVKARRFTGTCGCALYRTPQKESLLLLAIRHKLEAVADQLCEVLGADISNVSAADSDGNTPLWVALRSRQESIASKLVRGLHF